MLMILNELLTRQNVFTKILLKDDSKELSKELKVKVMRIRMAYNKIRKKFDDEVKEFVDELVPEELKNLNAKSEKTPEEKAREKELSNKVNSEYQEYLVQKGDEEVTDIIEDSLTMDEYSEIVEVNAGNDIEINGNNIPAADFLEAIYDLFVKE